MLWARGQKKSHLQKEFRLEKETFVRGTSYVGIEDCTISFFCEAHCSRSGGIFCGEGGIESHARDLPTG
jgi:hypothetical protein